MVSRFAISNGVYSNGFLLLCQQSLSALRQDMEHGHSFGLAPEDMDEKPLVRAHLAGNLNPCFFLDPVKIGFDRLTARACSHLPSRDAPGTNYRVH